MDHLQCGFPNLFGTSMDGERSSEDKEYVAGLEKGLAIIEAFGILNRPMTLTQSAELTEHSRAPARRFFFVAANYF